MLLLQLACAASMLACGAGAPTNTARAIRVVRAPSVDARDTGDVWRSIPAVSEFRQWLPHDDAPPTFRTEFRVAYDAENLYVLVRAFDPHPDSIVRHMARRDDFSSSDEIAVYVDPTGDHRSGYEFYLSAAGVQRDAALSADVREDYSWDGVWDGAARVDSLGWIAEFRIPFSQLRFAPGETNQIGFFVDRYVPRLAEQTSWPAYHTKHNGIVSQFGTLEGLRDIHSGGSIDVAPFVRTQNRGNGAFSGGADVRLRLASSVTVNATVLPDFGQVEADPSVVNLTSVETFYPEQRPFFLDGTGIYSVQFNCTAFNCFSEGLFYSRRVGRAPQLASTYGDAGSYAAAPILGAAKVTARAPGNVSVGALLARTGQITDGAARTLEPGTTYGVVRMERDSRDDLTGVSFISTLVDRSLDTWSAPYLARSAVVNGGTFRHRFGNGGEYEVWGSATASGVAGSRAALSLLQQNGVHDLQRPGSHLAFDSTRTRLDGDQEELALGKYGGAWQFESAFDRQSPGYETNDLGYLQRADKQTLINWLGYVTRVPRSVYHSLWANVNEWQTWNASGLRLDDAANTNAHILFANNWQVNVGVTGQHFNGSVCDHCARGGPALREDPQFLSFFDLTADSRLRVAPEIDIPWTTGDGGRLHSITVNPLVTLRLTDRLQANLGVSATRTRDNTQWVGNFTDSATTRYAFARLDQTTRSITMRASYAATPTLSLQVYAAPFASDGVYSKVRALSDTPRAPRYDDRFVPFTAPPGTALRFAVRQLRATTVLRWQYATGSTLYLVWSHERDGSDDPSGDSWIASARDLLRLQPVNTVTLKASYWLNWTR